jgi:hypothetical protein
VRQLCFIALASVVLLGNDVLNGSQRQDGSWIAPYAADPTYWERVEPESGVLLRVSAVAWIRAKTQPGETFGTIADSGPLYNQRGEREMDGLVPVYVVGTVTELEFGGMEASGITVRLRRSKTGYTFTCMKAALARFWHLTNARWQAMQACRSDLDWHEPQTLRFPLSTRYVAKAGYSLSLTLQLDAADNQLSARVVP